MTLHSAKGLEFPDGHPGRPRRGTVSALAVERRRGGARGGAAALLRRHDARAAAPRADRRGAAPRSSASISRASRRGSSTRCPPSSSSASRRRSRRRGYQGNFPHYEFRTNPYGRGGAGARARKTPAYAYEDEDQSTGMALRPGMRVRHPQFGVGSVISVEALDDDTKLVVRFDAVGAEDAAREVRAARAGIDASTVEGRDDSGIASSRSICRARCAWLVYQCWLEPTDDRSPSLGNLGEALSLPAADSRGSALTTAGRAARIRQRRTCTSGSSTAPTIASRDDVDRRCSTRFEDAAGGWNRRLRGRRTCASTPTTRLARSSTS